MSAPSDLPGPAPRRLFLAIAVLALAGAAAGGWMLWYRLSRGAKETHAPPSVAPADFRPRAASVPVHVRFTDITEPAGIRFRHSNGAQGKKLLPETMGGACAFIDHDRDGDQDLLFINSCEWPGSGALGAPPAQALYENDGKGAFTDVTVARGLAVSFYGMGAAVGDHDGDGWDDILFTTIGGERLFRNAAIKTRERHRTLERCSN